MKAVATAPGSVLPTALCCLVSEVYKHHTPTGVKTAAS